MDLVAASPEAALVDKPGGIFVRRGEQMSEEDRALLQTVARVVLLDDAGTLIEQVERRGRTEVAIPCSSPPRPEPAAQRRGRMPQRDLTFFNGLGGFSRDGREYVMILGPGQTTPAPWVNVIANPQFGTVVSESGNAYTWAENSHEFRLTPWYNDPVPTPAARRSTSATRKPAVSGRPRRCRRAVTTRMSSVTASATASSNTLRTASSPSCAFMSRPMRRQVRPAEDRQSLRSATPALGDRLLGVGPGRTTRQDAHARGDRAGPGQRALFARTRTARSSPTGSPLSTAARPFER